MSWFYDNWIISVLVVAFFLAVVHFIVQARSNKKVISDAAARGAYDAVEGLHFEGLGGIVSGTPGLEDKQKKNQYHYLIINYLDSAGVLKGITFQETLNIFRLKSFVDSVKKQLGSSLGERTTVL